MEQTAHPVNNRHSPSARALCPALAQPHDLHRDGHSRAEVE